MARSSDDIFTLEFDEFDDFPQFGINSKRETATHLSNQGNASRKTYLDELDELLTESCHNHSKQQTDTSTSDLGISRITISRPIRPSASGMFKQLSGVSIAHIPTYAGGGPSMEAEEILEAIEHNRSAFSKPPSKSGVKLGGWVESVGNLSSQKLPVSYTNYMDRPSSAAVSQQRTNFQPTLLGSKPTPKRSVFQAAGVNSLDSSKGNGTPKLG